MAETRALLTILADGRFHSGEALGERLGVTRAAVWKQVRSLRASGLDIHAVRGRGYRLGGPVELFDAALVLEAMTSAGRRLLTGLEVLSSVDSTNAYLIREAARGAAAGRVCLAETQQAGRGRRGRHWASPPGGNIYLSVLTRCESGVTALSGLSLAVGVGIARALSRAGVPDIGLKWPNDVLWQGRKLAGVLMEVSGESAGPCDVITGIGLNVRMTREAASEIEQPWVDLHTVMDGVVPSRNRLAGLLLDTLLPVLDSFVDTGLAPYVDEWNRLDMYAGRQVLVTTPGGVIGGECRGVAPNGALLVMTDGKYRQFAAGEISLRPI